jgi:hypothetical protein
MTTSRGANAGGISPVAAGILTLALMLVYFWLSGTLFPDDTTGYHMSSAQITGMSLTYSTTPAFLVAALLYSQRRTHIILDQLVHSGCVTREAAMSSGAGGTAIGLARSIAATLVGTIIGALQGSWQPVLDSLGEPRMFMVLGITVGNIVTWVAVVHVVLRRALASLDLARLGRDHTHVDLLRLDALLPFGQIGTLHLLIVVVAISLSAFQSLDAELRWDNYSSALAAGIPAGISLLLLPMIGIRQKVREVKRHAHESLDEAIAHADRDLEPASMSYLGDLLQQREAIQRAREWPLNTTAFSRIAVYFVIPPIAWVGSALVEILIQAAL